MTVVQQRRTKTSSSLEIVYMPDRDGLDRLLGPAEAQLMRYLWDDLTGGRTTTQIMDHFSDGRAYSTYMTTLMRMVDKGLLTRTPDPLTLTNGFIYTPAMDEEAFYRKAVRTILDALYDDCADILDEELQRMYGRAR